MMEKETRSKFDNSHISRCPYCGHKPYLKHTVMFHDGKPYFAYCGTMMCRRIKTNGHETMQGAIDEWERLCEDARKIELEPCPCCGKIPTCTNCPDKEYSKFFIVSCTNPDYAYKEVVYGQTEIGAKKNWSYYCEQKRKEKNE